MTPGVLASKWIEDEVKEFSATGRDMAPINVADMLQAPDASAPFDFPACQRLVR